MQILWHAKLALVTTLICIAIWAIVPGSFFTLSFFVILLALVAVIRHLRST